MGALVSTCCVPDTVSVAFHQRARHQLSPLIFIHDDNTNEQRPLRFGEPILNGLGCFEGDEVMVDVQESQRSDPNSQTNIHISIQQRLPTSVILGQSRYSPIRRSKQFILDNEKMETVMTPDTISDLTVSVGSDDEENHALFLEALPRYFAFTAFPKLATIVIVMDCEHQILLTRRHSKVRSFPSCFVNSGGSVDDGESLEDAAKRWVMEEVGIAVNTEGSGEGVDSMEMIALWESAFPDSSSSDLVNPRQIMYHHIVPIYVCKLKGEQSKYPLTLCKKEVDVAVWIDAVELDTIINAKSTPRGRLIGMDPKGKVVEVKKRWLYGIYPNTMGQGIARGHVFGINKLLKKFNGDTSSKL